MFGKSKIKALSDLLNSDYMINAGVKSLKEFLETLSPDRPIGSITDEEIISYVKNQYEKMKDSQNSF